MLAADQIRAGSANVVLAGGIESMSNAPYLLPKARAGLRMGHAQLIDHMFFDGLQSPFDGNMMGYFADATSKKYGFTRGQQDEFAAESVRRALAAVEKGYFEAEIAAATVQGSQGRAHRREGRNAVHVRHREDSHAEARIQQGRHRDRRQLLIDLRRRSGAGRRERGQARASNLKPLARIVASRQLRAGARVVHDRAGRRNPGCARQDRLEREPGRPVSRSTKRSPAWRWRRSTI